MKSTWIVSALAAVALNFPVSAYADDTTPAPEAPVAVPHHVVRHHPASSAIAVSANPGDIGDKWAGTYSSNEINFVTVKRLTFTQEKDGSIKIHGALVGFPDEVSIGEATAEAYADRNNKPNPDTMVASFSSEKYKPLMVITPGQWDGTHLRSVLFTCYMKDVDGSKVHISGQLMRDSDGSNIHISGDLRRDQGGGSGPSASAAGPSAQADVDFGPYMADLQRRIKRAWFPPKGHEGDRVVVQFRIHKGGELSNLAISHSSGLAIADQAALSAVGNASPFKPLPAGAPENCGVQFTFDYNVFGGGGHGVFLQF